MSADGIHKQRDPLDEFVELLVFTELKWDQSDLDDCGLPADQLRQIVAKMREKIIDDGFVRVV